MSLCLAQRAQTSLCENSCAEMRKRMTYNLHDLRIEGIQVLYIQNCVIKGQIGEHSTLLLQAAVENEEEILLKRAETQPIHVYFEEKGRQKTIFHGIITQCKVHCAAQVYELELEAKSYTYLMDIQKHSRSFQDTSMKYSIILKKILLDYQTEGFIQTEDRETGELIIQYEETDWKFLKRILSQLEITISPAAESKGVAVYAGIPELKTHEIPYTLLQVGKDMHQYYYLKANQQSVNDVYFTQYTIESQEILSLFEQVSIEKQSFCIYAYTYYFKGNELTAVYYLQHKQGMKVKKQYPMHLIGAALEGSIVDAQKDKVLVHLDIDSKFQKSKSYWFPYSTMSASDDGSGWYCMPEKGDVVRIYFPSKYTAQAIALSAVSNYHAKAGTEDKMQNPNTKFLSTRHNKSVTLAPDKIRVACNGNAAVLDITAEGKVSILASKELNIAAKEDIEISAVNELKIHAEKAVQIFCDKGGQALLTEEGYAILKGTEVKIN